jgi:hypothetical protein
MKPGWPLGQSLTAPNPILGEIITVYGGASPGAILYSYTNEPPPVTVPATEPKPVTEPKPAPTAPPVGVPVDQTNNKPIWEPNPQPGAPATPGACGQTCILSWGVVFVIIIVIALSPEGA